MRITKPVVEKSLAILFWLFGAGLFTFQAVKAYLHRPEASLWSRYDFVLLVILAGAWWWSFAAACLKKVRSLEAPQLEPKPPKPVVYVTVAGFHLPRSPVIWAWIAALVAGVAIALFGGIWGLGVGAGMVMFSARALAERLGVVGP